MSYNKLSKYSKKFIKDEIKSKPIKISFFILFSIIAASLETLGLGLVFPLMMVIVKPDYFEKYQSIQNFINFIGIHTHREFTALLVIIIAIIMVAKNGFMAGFNLWQVRTFAKWKAQLANRLMKIYLYSDFKIHMEKTSSEIIRNLSLAAVVFDQFIMAMISILVTTCVASGIITLLLLTLPSETVFSISILAVTAIFLYLATRKKFSRIGKESNILYEQRQRLMQQSIGAIKEAKILGKEDYFLHEYTKIEKGYFGRQGFYNFLASVPSQVLETMIILSMLALITQILLINQEQPETLATLGLLAAAMFRLAPQVNRILIQLQLLNLGRNSLDIISEEIYENEHRIRHHGLESGEQLAAWERMDFVNLNYRYPNNTWALKDINLSIKRNEFIGITGPSGSGKSTLMMVLLGLLEPTEGQFLIDSEDLRSSQRLRRWQNGIGYVPQGLFLVDAPITNNIAYCETGENINEDKVKKVMELAHLHDLFAENSEAYTRPIGENGGQLSGGQKQRVIIARALYHDPKLLAFDEATSALDAGIEKAITNTLNEFKGEKTIVAIAHKLTTLQNCDRIVMMESGKVIDFGTFSELEERCQPFKRLVKLSKLHSIKD